MNYKPPINKHLAIYALALALTGPAIAAEDQAELPLEELRTFADVFNQIRVGYVEEVDDSTLLEYAIQGMLTGLDPHSVYMTEDAFDHLQSSTSGEFSGLGLEVGMKDGFVTVISPIDGTPAARAGLQSGDVILELNNVSIKGQSLNKAIEQMRGEKAAKLNSPSAAPGNPSLLPLPSLVTPSRLPVYASAGWNLVMAIFELPNFKSEPAKM